MKVLKCPAEGCDRRGIPLLYPTSEDLTRHCICGHSWLPADDIIIDSEPGMFHEVKVSAEDFQKLFGWSVG